MGEGGRVHLQLENHLSRQGADGLPPGEGAFLPCTAWYADALLLAVERHVDDPLVSLEKDVLKGLLEPKARALEPSLDALSASTISTRSPGSSRWRCSAVITRKTSST